MLNSFAVVSLPDLNSVQDIGQFIGQIYTFSLYVVGIVVFVRFIWAGWLYFAAAGNVGKSDNAKTMMTNAVIGVVLLFSAYLILYVINPDLVSHKFDQLVVPAGNATGSTTGNNGNNPPGNPPPGAAGNFTITELVPKIGQAGSVFAIKGDNFPTDAVVIFGDETVSDVTVADAHTITLRVPADLQPGDYTVDVLVEVTGQTAEKPTSYKVVAP